LALEQSLAMECNKVIPILLAVIAAQWMPV
jgi:hypothetical protein